MQKNTLKNSFKERVYKLVKNIPKGQVMTYGQIAQELGQPKAARAVGNALHQNRDPQIPCYRVVNRKGKVAKNFAFGGAQAQKARLVAEGIVFVDEKVRLVEKE